MNAITLDKKLGKARQLMEQRQHAEALKLYSRLVRQSPDGALWVEYGHAALVAADLEEAMRIWEKARALERANGEVLLNLAKEYEKLGLHAKVRELYAAAAKLQPTSTALLANLARLWLETGPAEAAREPLARWLELDPRDEAALYLTAQLERRTGQLAEAEQHLRDLLTQGLRQPQIRQACYFELARVLDQTGRQEEAMASLETGKALVRQRLDTATELRAVEAWHQKVRAETHALPQNILHIWAQAFPPKARSGAASVAFLGGPARSGATLLAQVLAAHPGVAAADEARAFPNILALVNILEPNIPAQRLNILRERYLKLFAKASGGRPGAQLFLDKNPAPTVFLPAFLRAFPELRVLMTVRDPRDALLSLYFEDRASSNYLTLEQLAEHYRCVMDVWLRVREWEGLAGLEMRYEALVADVEKEGRRVLQFLGLEWHADQARFFEQNPHQPVLHGNYEAVHQPVSSRSVGRWRAYERHLAPVLPLLEPYCKTFGYA